MFTTTDYKEGYWWVKHSDYKEPFVAELRFMTFDHTRDGDRWILEVVDEFYEEPFDDFTFIKYIEPPEIENV